MAAPGVVSLTWSPDGKRLVYESSTQGSTLGSLQFHQVNVDGSDDHVIGASGQGPAWSPDGSWIAYSGPNGAVWKSHLDGTGARQLTHPKGGQQDDQPRWSPDGATVAFVRNGGIYTAPSGGGSVQLVFADPGANAGSPSYAGAQALLFDQCTATGPAAGGGIYRIGVDGRGLSLVTSAHYGCSAASADWTASAG